MLTLHRFLDALAAAPPDAGLALELPDGTAVPAHFHVTEVGRVRKDFIDCGGTVRTSDRCVLQVWVAGDVDHRVRAGKLAQIIGIARPLLGDADLELEVEYDVGVITQLPVLGVSHEAGTGGGHLLRVRLGGKHTACLAPDRCGVPEGGGDGAAGGCCAPPAPALVTLGTPR